METQPTRNGISSADNQQADPAMKPNAGQQDHSAASIWLPPCMPLSIEGRVDCERAQHAARKYPKPKAAPPHLPLCGNHRAWQKVDGTAFSERTKTEVVSAHGAFILLRADQRGTEPEAP
jgi:hypothetical protein